MRLELTSSDYKTEILTNWTIEPCACGRTRTFDILDVSQTFLPLNYTSIWGDRRSRTLTKTLVRSQVHYPLCYTALVRHLGVKPKTFALKGRSYYLLSFWRIRAKCGNRTPSSGWKPDAFSSIKLHLACGSTGERSLIWWVQATYSSRLNYQPI